ncbi:hypothetical protein [Oleiagrimonas soli]|uniref:Uncharacterized protein n=1 Tax=Oleiagrimonas soli TaxID=1543381 RepID=A0A841KFY6_9GAMM|nr:hypothetical protein [Oleiagrimonas soli]MBB6183890.1 hypothetical protein [Oleiagrimonas soli]
MLAVSGVLLLLSTVQNAVSVFDGATMSQIHTLAASQKHDAGAFVLGYESGLGLVILIKLLCGLALLGLLLRRARETRR